MAIPNKCPLKIWSKGSVGVSRDCPIFGYALLSQERVKLRTSNFVRTFIGSIGTKARENVGNSSCGPSQGVPNIFRAPIYRAHCAVIFAIAQLSCLSLWQPAAMHAGRAGHCSDLYSYCLLSFCFHRIISVVARSIVTKLTPHVRW